MDTDAMAGAMDLMETAGRQLSTGWGAVTGRLAGLSGRLGQGELGAAFLSRYERSAATTTAAVDRHCRQPGLLAATGHECAALYASADRNAVGALAPAVDPRATGAVLS